MRANSVVERRGRIVIGRTGRRLVAAKQRESVLVFGPPGSGKTSAFAIPNILEWDGPAVVCSVTSEILRTTIRVRSSHGRMAWIYDPTGSVGDVLRAGWDPIPQCVRLSESHEVGPPLRLALGPDERHPRRLLAVRRLRPPRPAPPRRQRLASAASKT